MNKALLTDPVVLICAGVVFIGVIALFWAIGKLKNMGSAIPDESPVADLIASASPLSEIDIRSPETPSRPPVAVAPAVSKDVADRLETMSQRLSEMQTVLMKQSTTSASGAAGGAPVGQGFSPETIDKLLKIIGNVIQQVDVLQKNLNTPK